MFYFSRFVVLKKLGPGHTFWRLIFLFKIRPSDNIKCNPNYFLLLEIYMMHAEYPHTIFFPTYIYPHTIFFSFRNVRCMPIPIHDFSYIHGPNISYPHTLFQYMHALKIYIKLIHFERYITQKNDTPFLIHVNYFETYP